MVVPPNGVPPTIIPNPNMLQIFATKEIPRNYYLRWRDFTLKSLEKC